MVRLWLREHFEAEHGPQDIPATLVEQNLADPKLADRLFHPQLRIVCQLLIVPAERGEDGRAARPPAGDDELPTDEWQAAAREAFAPLAARSRRLTAEILASDRCSLLGTLLSASQREFATAAGALRVRYERFAYAPQTVTGFDPTWLAQVDALEQPGVVGPFATRFGLHLVFVAAVEPARLPEGSLPPDELAAAREQALRAEMLTDWRADRLQATLAELRERYPVRLAPARAAD